MKTSTIAAVFGVVVALTLSCRTDPPPVYTTYHGIEVYGHAYPRIEVELATHATMYAASQASAAYEGEQKGQFDYCRIDYVDGPFRCSASSTGLCAGMHWPTRCYIMISKLGDCVAASATAHEIIHLLNWEIEKKQIKHTDPTWFGAPNSVEYRAGAVTAEYCDGR
tara:strand:+ start:609 stop:1106 length:498 start_codon:yes stop_codon:yes gene_type:complete